LKASYLKYILHFKKPSGTSRGILIDKETWFLTLEEGGKKGIGECAVFRGLSADDRPDYEEKLRWQNRAVGNAQRISVHPIWIGNSFFIVSRQTSV
jgi:hypothetical protein